MSYPNQNKVVDRLHSETISALHAERLKGLGTLSRTWIQYRRHLQLAIMDAYHQAAPKGKWSLGLFKNRSARQLFIETKRILDQFRSVSLATAKASLNTIYRNSLLRYAWILDETTPPGINIIIPYRQKLHEAAAVSFYQGKQASQMWTERWTSWLDAYHNALNHNITMGAINESAIDDAVNEVDSTKVNTPAYGLWDALARIFDYESTSAMGAGGETIADVNEDVVEEEIWKTRGDLRVCDDCDANEGLTAEDVDSEIPAHPNCHCYWRLVPKEWAELLRSGDPADKALATQMDAHGLVPTAMAIRDASGHLAGYTTVEFGPWQNENLHAVMGQ